MIKEMTEAQKQDQQTADQIEQLGNALNTSEGKALEDNYSRSKKLWMECGGTEETWLEYFSNMVKRAVKKSRK